METPKEEGHHGDLQTPESCVADFCLIPVSPNLVILALYPIHSRDQDGAENSPARHAYRFCIPWSRRSAATDAEE